MAPVTLLYTHSRLTTLDYANLETRRPRPGVWYVLPLLGLCVAVLASLGWCIWTAATFDPTGKGPGGQYDGEIAEMLICPHVVVAGFLLPVAVRSLWMSCFTSTVTCVIVLLIATGIAAAVTFANVRDAVRPPPPPMITTLGDPTTATPLFPPVPPDWSRALAALGIAGSITALLAAGVAGGIFYARRLYQR